MLVVILALLGAALFALAGAAEQGAASRLTRLPAAARRDTPGPDGTARRLEHGIRSGLRLAAGFLRSPLWLAGWAADALGFAAQAGALHAGQLPVVQPLLVLTLAVQPAARGSRDQAAAGPGRLGRRGGRVRGTGACAVHPAPGSHGRSCCPVAGQLRDGRASGHPAGYGGQRADAGVLMRGAPDQPQRHRRQVPDRDQGDLGALEPGDTGHGWVNQVGPG